MATRTYSINRRDDQVHRLTDLSGVWLSLFSAQGERFKDIMAVPGNPDIVMKVGESGEISVSNDAGGTWNVPGGGFAAVVSFRWLYEIWIVDANTAYTVGWNGVCGKTIDGGATFEATGTFPTLSGILDDNDNSTALHFIDANTGVVMTGKRCFKTIDGGLTWTPLNGGNEIEEAFLDPVEYNAVHMSADQQVITAHAKGGIFRSTDAGATWSVVHTYAQAEGLHMTWINDNELWGTGLGNSMIKSNDGGATWSVIRAWGQGLEDIYAAHFYDSNNGYFSQGDAMHVTTDGGTTSIETNFTEFWRMEAVWTEFDPQQDPCGCDEGYVYNPETGLCDGFEAVAAVDTGITYPVVDGDKSPSYGFAGMIIYEDITAKPQPIKNNSGSIDDNLNNPLLVQGSIANDLWGDTGMPDTDNGPLNLRGIWADAGGGGGGDNLPTNEWIGISVCIDIPETKTYYIGVAGDNRVRVSIDGDQVVSLQGCSNNNNFTTFHIFPVTIASGTRIFYIEGHNCQDLAGFIMELYDSTPAALLAMTTQMQLDAVTLYTTYSRLGTNFDLGDNIGYNCPGNYILSTCPLSCVLPTSKAYTECDCMQLTDCEGVLDPLFTQDPSMLPYVGGTVQIDEFPDVCWQVTNLGPQACPGAADYTVNTFFPGCNECLEPVVCFHLVSCNPTQYPDIYHAYSTPGNDLAAVVGHVIKVNGLDGCYTCTIQTEPCTVPGTNITSIDLVLGQDCQGFEVNPCPIVMDTVLIGETGSVDVTVTNTSEVNQDIAFALGSCGTTEMSIVTASPLSLAPGASGVVTVEYTPTVVVSGTCELIFFGACDTFTCDIRFDSIAVPDCPHFNICITGPNCAPDCIKPGEIIQFDLGGNISPVAYPTVVTFQVVNQGTDEIVFTEQYEVADDTELDAILINVIAPGPGAYCAEVCLPGCNTKRVLCFDVCEPFDIYKDDCNHWHVHRPTECAECTTNEYLVKIYELENEDNPVVDDTLWDILQDNTFEFELPSDGIFIFEMKDPNTGEVLYSFAAWETCALQECFKIMMDKIMCSCADPCCKKCNGVPQEQMDFARGALNKLVPLYLTYLGMARRNELYQHGMKWITDDHMCFLHDANATLAKILEIIEDCGCLCPEQKNTASERGDCLSC